MRDIIAIVETAGWPDSHDPDAYAHGFFARPKLQALASVADGKRSETVDAVVEASSSGRLTPTERTYLSMWSGDHFLTLNVALRSGGAPDAFCRALDSAIAKFILPSGTVLYREIDRDTYKQIYGADVAAGQVITDQGFMATSRNQPAGFGKVVLHIEIGADQHGLDMAMLSDNPSEHEVLLPRGQSLQVVSIKPPPARLKNVQINVRT